MAWFNDLWGSVDKLSSLINFSNWGIAATIVVTFLFTVTVIKAGNRKDALLRVSELEKEQRISEANKLAAEASERAGKLEKEAAQLTASNLQLEAAIAPRRLSEQQQKALSSLGEFASRAVEIKSYSADTEGLVLASQILDELGKSRIEIIDNRLTMQPAGSVVFGVLVQTTSLFPSLSEYCLWTES